MSQEVNVKIFYLFIALLLSASLLTGCGNPQEIEDTKNLGQSYYEAIKANDIDKALSFCSSEFFRTASKGDAIELLQNINLKLGNLQSYEYDYYAKTSYGGTSGSHTRYDLYYDVIYAKGSSRETLMLTKSEDGTFEIVGYNIKSNDLINN